MTSEETPTAGDGMHCFGKREDLIQAKRVVKLVNGREVVVLYHEGDFYALDVHCYHSGGNLSLGDIEEIAGRLCIVCPWHKYKITLLEGEALYRPVDPSVKPPRPGPWTSKGVKQRVHSVTEKDGYIYVIFNPFTGPIESDCYQTENFRATRTKRKQLEKK